jgi:hypothetical protein
MFLRQLRWLAAALAVACLAPSQARADIQILVEELDSGGGVVGSSGFVVGSPNGTFPYLQTFGYSSAGGHFNLSGSTGTNSNLGNLNSSLSTSFTAGFTDNFVASQGHTLRITVTDDGYTAVTGQSSTLMNSAGASIGFQGGILQVDSFSRIYNPNDPSAVPAGSTTQLATGLTVAGPTPTATDRLPGDSNTRITATSVPPLSSPYAIQQVITISVTETGTLDEDALFSGSAGARVDTSAAPIPAPGGLALALVALPLIGLRRALRKNAV